MLPQSLGIAGEQSGIAERVFGQLGIVAVPVPGGTGCRLHGHLDAATVGREGIVRRMPVRSGNMDGLEVVAVLVELKICFGRGR